MKQQLVYRKRGRRYEPFGIDGRPWNCLPFGDYVVSIRPGCTSMRRLPEIHLAFSEPALRELGEKMSRDMLSWFQQTDRFSPAGVADKLADVVREFFQGKEVIPEKE